MCFHAFYRFLAESNLVAVNVSEVDVAFAKHMNDSTKGVKVHFAMDRSGLFRIEKADVSFDLAQPEVCNYDSIVVFKEWFKNGKKP